MADICFDVDTALAEVAVNKVPIVDAATAATIKTDLAYNAAGMALFWHFVTPAGAHTVTAVTPTTAGVHDWAAQSTSGIYTLEIPASGGTINNDAEGFGWFTGFATGYLPWSSPVYCFRAAGLNDALIEGAYSTTRGLAGTALPNAAADAAGGLPISDAGGLNMDGLATAAAVATVDANVDNLVSGIIFGAAATGTLSTTQASTDLTGYSNDQLIGRPIIWLTGACEGEASVITDYVSTGGVLTFDALIATPGNGDTFKIV